MLLFKSIPIRIALTVPKLDPRRMIVSFYRRSKASKTKIGEAELKTTRSKSKDFTLRGAYDMVALR